MTRGKDNGNDKVDTQNIGEPHTGLISTKDVKAYGIVGTRASDPRPRVMTSKAYNSLSSHD